MPLKTKVVAVAIASIVVISAAGYWIERSVIRRQGVELIEGSMGAIILSAVVLAGMRETAMWLIPLSVCVTWACIL